MDTAIMLCIGLLWLLFSIAAALAAGIYVELLHTRRMLHQIRRRLLRRTPVSDAARQLAQTYGLRTDDTTTLLTSIGSLTREAHDQPHV